MVMSLLVLRVLYVVFQTPLNHYSINVCAASDRPATPKRRNWIIGCLGINRT